MKRRQDTQQRYRGNNASDQQARRYRAAIAKAKSGSSIDNLIPKEGPIFGSLLWDEIKDEIAPQPLVTIVFLANLLVSVLRDESTTQVDVINKEIGNYRSATKKDEIAPNAASA